MSMLSAQCDELRFMAESVGLAMPQAATMMMDAADTIWELRDSVHRERAEADRLREENERFVIKLNAEHIVRQNVEAENAKLRELVAEMFNACPMCVNCAHNHLTVGWYDRMRELGVDVD